MATAAYNAESASRQDHTSIAVLIMKAVAEELQFGTPQTINDIDIKRTKRPVIKPVVLTDEQIQLLKAYEIDPTHSVIDIAHQPDIPEHRKIFAEIDSLGEGSEGITRFFSGKFDPFYAFKRSGAPSLTRQIVEDAHIAPSGDVLRSTGIDRDSRPYHLRPLVIRRNLSVSSIDAQRISDALTTLNASKTVARYWQHEFSADAADAMSRLEALAAELRQIDAIPDDDAMSHAVRYFDDTNTDKPADDNPDDDDTGADRGFEQYVALDDIRDESYHVPLIRNGKKVYNNGQPVMVIDTNHPACPWSLKQPKYVQTIGRALKTAATPEALKEAAAPIINPTPGTFGRVQLSVLWGIYHTTQRRLIVKRYGALTAIVSKWIARLHAANADLGKAAAAINGLPNAADKVILRAEFNKASWKRHHR